MALWLRALAALSEDLHLVPSIHMVVTVMCKSSSRVSNAIFWPRQAPGRQVMYRHTHKQSTHTHKIKVSKILEHN